MSENIPRPAVTNSIGYLLRRAHKLSLPLAERTFAGQEITLTHWVTLILLRDGIVSTSGALARCLGHNSGATTRMLDQLEERRLIARQRSAEDRRIIDLTLTDAGLVTANRFVPHMDNMWDDLLDDFDADERTMLKLLLQRLVARLDIKTAERGVG